MVKGSPAKKVSFSCYLIGEESLLINCASLLLEAKHTILGIISPNPAIAQWANQKNIPHYSCLKSAEDTLTNKKFDYLFSIVNSQILPKKILQLPRKLAINYHDSLLPRYAGVHATSWAILNQEKKHGITWHVIDEKLDTGDILKQQEMLIDKDETALSLSLKCYQAATNSFSKLTFELATNSYERKPQDLTQRTYFGLHQKPPGNGWVNWNNPAEDIERLFRAIYLGEQYNQFSTLKFTLGNHFYVVSELKLTKDISIKPAGTIINLGEDWLQVATFTNDIKIHKIKNLNGDNEDIEKVSKIYKLKSNFQLSSPNNIHFGFLQKKSTQISPYEKFWVKEISQIEPISFPFLVPSTTKISYIGKSISSYKLPEEFLKKIKKQFSSKTDQNITLTCLLSCLYRLGNQKIFTVDISYSSDIQQSKKFYNIFPCYLPFTLFFKKAVNFKEMLNIVSKKLVLFKKNECYLRDVNIRYPELKYGKLELPIAIIIHDILSPFCTDKFIHPVTFVVSKNSISVYLKKNNCQNLHAILAKLPDNFHALVNGIIKNSKVEIDAVPIIPTKELKMMLVDWNNTENLYPRNKNFKQLFEEQVLKNPNNTAIVFKEKSLTFKELDEKSNQLAHYLIKRGAKTGDFIAICLTRGLEMIIGMVGILKIGGAYVPVSMELPAERVAYIFKDAKIKFAISRKNNLKIKHLSHIEIIDPFRDLKNIQNNILNNVTENNAENKPVYIIYTSGSTGTPKGVVINNRGLINMVFAKIKKLSITSRDRILNFSNISFDASVWEIFSSLLSGSTLYIASKDQILSGQVLFNFLDRNKITIATLPPSVLAITPSAPLLSLRAIISAGEPCTKQVIVKWGKRRTFINAYGPTEVTVCATMAICNKHTGPAVIGSPIANVKVYVLDERLEPTAVGVIGELYVSGDGLANGYLGNKELTKQRFISHTFAKGKSTRLYKTGDLVRWLLNGNLEYMGRSDEQVKIRSFRVELNEVSATLMQHPHIEQAVVYVSEINGRRQLQAYFIKKRTKKNKFKLTALQAYLKKKLPAYMLPSQYFEVEQFPLTTNNKIDKKALLEYGASLSVDKGIEKGMSYKEMLLAKVWRQVLNIGSVNKNDNFFSLGGDSIIAMQVVSRAGQLGLHLKAKDIFQCPTISTLANKAKEEFLNKTKIKNNQKFSLSPIQNWFFKQGFIDKEQFSQVCVLTISLPVDIKLLEISFHNLIKRHHGLRLRFCNENDTWRQYYSSHEKNSDGIIRAFNTSGYEKKDLAYFLYCCASEFQKKFNLKEGPLLTVGFFSGHSTTTAKLLIVAHHLIIDGVSWRILLEDLENIYQKISKLGKENFYPIGTSYQAWVEAIRNYKNAFEATQEIENKELIFSPTLLPTDYQSKKNLEAYSAVIYSEISTSDTEILLQRFPALCSVKIHEALIAMLVKTLATFMKTDSVLIDIENHGREEFSQELHLSKTVGWFTNLLPSLLKTHEGSLWDLVRSIQQQLQFLSSQGIGLGLAHCIGNNPFHANSQVAFNYLGQFDQIFRGKLFKFEDLRLISGYKNKRTHLINVEVSVRDKKIVIAWNYSKNHYKKHTIRRLMDCYLSNLRSLVNYYFILEKHSIEKSIHNTNKSIINKIYPLSHLQKGLLFHSVWEPNSESYIVQLLWKNNKSKKINLHHLHQAWTYLIERHEVLRTYFMWKNLERPQQVVQKFVKFPWIIYDWSSIKTQDELEERLVAFMKADRQAGFDLNNPPLLRITIFRLANKQFWKVATFHHILLDGWSLPILLNELESLYMACENKKFISLPSPHHFSNYIDWLENKEVRTINNFWKRYLKGFSTPIELMPLEKKTHSSANIGKEVLFDTIILPQAQSNRIRAFCQEQRLTLNTFFLGVWALMLYHYSQSDDVLFGVTLTARSSDLKESDEMVGLMINTLPMRVSFVNDRIIRKYLKEIKVNFSNISEHYNANLFDLKKYTSVTNGTALFNNIFVFEHYPQKECHIDFFKFNKLHVADSTHYPLAFIVNPEHEISIKLVYDGLLIDHNFVKVMKCHLQTLLLDVIDNSKKLISQANIFPVAEYNKILQKYNKTSIRRLGYQDVEKIFEEQVEKTPNNIAIVFGDQHVTYQELNNKSNQLAHYLLGEGVRRNDLIVILLKRSVEVVISMLGILKAGAAYVPVDDSYPKERFFHILHDTNSKIILTQSTVVKILSQDYFNGRKKVLLDRINWSSYPTTNVIFSSNENDRLAYVMYTSGSTGKPKGVVVSSSSVVNLLLAAKKLLNFSLKEVLLAISPVHFDIFTVDIYLPLIVGAKIILANEVERSSPFEIMLLIKKFSVSVIQATPSLWGVLVNQDWDKIRNIKLISTAEALNFHLAQKLKQISGEVWNFYGPTEATVWATAQRINELNSNEVLVPIGKPIGNVKVYILNKFLKPVPVGVMGELYIAGAGLAMGYLNKPHLSKEKFIDNPFIKDDINGKLYKTGDLARWRLDGNVEYVGRSDDQIKIRGFRVELGDIEHCLREYENIRQASVIGNIDDKQLLIAFITLSNKKKFNAAKVQSYLTSKLPYYMIPSKFIVIKSFPLTPNGKINKKLLMSFVPNNLSTSISTPYAAPVTKVESILATIWSELLSISKIGIYDNFFDLGGHSLLALQMMDKIKQELGVTFNMRVLFDEPTISGLSVLISQQRSDLILDLASVKTKANIYECLITLQSKGNKTPLFLVHPVGGTVFWYTTMVKYLDKDQPVYGIQDPGIQASSIPFETLEEMASYYVQAIRTIQPKGPYLLGGASAGGNISVEMARQLQITGESVAFIGLLDSWVPYPEALLRQEFFAANMRRQYNVMQEKFYSIGILGSESLLSLQLQRVQMYSKYKMPKINLKLTLFKAERIISVYQSINDGDFNLWNYYSDYPIEKYVVPGDHESMFHEPNVKVLARELMGRLNYIHTQHIKYMNELRAG
jgi:amino acid adenylation domain-containing protein/non-ribosomal peptide synthase protein (TIGR01720 family)